MELNQMTLQPSLLDKLTGHETTPVQGISVLGAVETLRQSLLRDIERLLNTRPRPRSYSPHLHELDSSLRNYGLAEFRGSLATGTDRDQFAQAIANTIRRFEPRLSDVEVLCSDEIDDLRGRALVRVQAQTSDAPDFFAFDIHAELWEATLRFHVGPAA